MGKGEDVKGRDVEPVKIEDAGDHEMVRYLFTTKTCPNCKVAKRILGNEPYTLVDAEEEQDLVSRFGVRQAPTLIVLHDGEVEKYVNASSIKKYVDAYRSAI